MPGDPSRRPSNERVSVQGNANDVIWIECNVCLGDGWHYPGSWTMPDRARKTHKQRCPFCEGRGAVQRAALLCGPSAKRVPPPPGWSSG